MSQARGRSKGLEFQLEVAPETVGRKLGRQRAVWNATHPASLGVSKGIVGEGKRKRKRLT